MSKINDGGPAFPSTIQYFPDDKNANEEQGMTLRDWFATHATDADIEAILNPPFERTTTHIISRYEARYTHADAMLKARGVKP
jgi:hypothetical protein